MSLNAVFAFLFFSLYNSFFISEIIVFYFYREHLNKISQIATYRRFTDYKVKVKVFLKFYRL